MEDTTCMKLVSLLWLEDWVWLDSNESWTCVYGVVVFGRWTVAAEPVSLWVRYFGGDQDQDRRSEITRIMVDQNNELINFCPSGVVTAFDLLACEQALLFGRVKRVSQERASEQRSREAHFACPNRRAWSQPKSNNGQLFRFRLNSDIWLGIFVVCNFSYLEMVDILFIV